MGWWWLWHAPFKNTLNSRMGSLRAWPPHKHPLMVLWGGKVGREVMQCKTFILLSRSEELEHSEYALATRSL